MFFRIGWVALVTALAIIASTQSSAIGQDCKSKYAKVVFSDEDKQVFEHLNSLSKDRNEFIKAVVILLAISEIQSAPKSTSDLIKDMGVGVFAPVDASVFDDAAKGVIQLSAKETYEALTYFTSQNGKYVDKKFENYRPKGDVLRLLQCLEARYRKLAGSGK